MKYKVYHTYPENKSGQRGIFNSQNSSEAHFDMLVDAKDYAEMKKNMGRLVSICALVEQEIPN